MLGNYLKISIAVLLRRKFLTFVNLFGTVVTLTVLVSAFAMLESVVSPAGAQHRQGNILTITGLMLSNTERTRNMGGGPGMAFYERYIEPLETPDQTSISTMPQLGTSYIGGGEITSQFRRTDAAYWEILDFDVLAGRTLLPDDIHNGRFVAVINQATADRFFPKEDAIGESITVDSETFEVVGVVANEPQSSMLAYADIWVPLTTSDYAAFNETWMAGNAAMLYIEDRSMLDAAKAEYQEVLKGFEYSVDPTEFETAASAAQTALEIVASVALSRFVDPQNRLEADLVPQFIAVVTLVSLLFMALPAINMVNLNIGRMLERAPEIGLRKAAGASKRVLIGQFIFESIVLSALGGLLAFAIAPFVLRFLNETVFTYGALSLNLAVFIAGFVFIVVFGVLSGAYPAWKMAKLEPASALRGHRDA